jgi:hypothetical protein
MYQYISLIFDKCSTLERMQSRPNNTSYINFHFNEFVANALHNNTWDQKKAASNLRKEMRLFFSFKHQKFGVRVNRKIKDNQAKWHKVNYFYFCFVPK